MMDMEYRAYDNKQKMMVYSRDLWLPKGLKKLGHKEYPVRVTDNGIQYTLNCISNHYENDWEEEVVSILDIEIMPSTSFRDSQEPQREIYSNDIISFNINKSLLPFEDKRNIGRIKYNEASHDWMIVDKDDQFIEILSKVQQPTVLGNYFDNPEFLDVERCIFN